MPLGVIRLSLFHTPYNFLLLSSSLHEHFLHQHVNESRKVDNNKIPSFAVVKHIQCNGFYCNEMFYFSPRCSVSKQIIIFCPESFLKKIRNFWN